MNWEAIGAIAEILGAGAVVITLGYLSLQVRYVKEQNVMNTFQHVYDSMNEWAGRIAESSSLASVVMRGQESYSALTSEEQFQFENAYLCYLKIPVGRR